jgi:hypothetical protein
MQLLVDVRHVCSVLPVRRHCVAQHPVVAVLDLKVEVSEEGVTGLYRFVIFSTLCTAVSDLADRLLDRQESQNNLQEGATR